MSSPLESAIRRQAASFRDPAGFVYLKDGTLLRQVHASYAEDYESFMSSGLYEELVADSLIVDHEERPLSEAADSRAWQVLRPRELEFVSYPYEWSFSQLKDAALLTLEIAARALARGLVLKDATGFNVTFDAARPIWLDSLSFERYREGEPWRAYSQFSRHFLAPLALAAHVDPRLTDLLRNHLEGIPLDLTSRLLPRWTWTRPSLLLHLHLHGRSQVRYAATDPGRVTRGRSFSRMAFEGLLAGLRDAVDRLTWEPTGPWSSYDRDNSYTDRGQRRKAEVIGRWLTGHEPLRILDIGANTGFYSRIAADLGHSVLALDSDPGASEVNYRRCRSDSRSNVLPLRIDFLNPSPDQGWSGTERTGLLRRVNPDVVMALAVSHHLALSGHVGLSDQAALFARLAPILIIEWVPLDDPQASLLARNRADQLRAGYSIEMFEKAFGVYFSVREDAVIPDSGRRLLLLARHPEPGEALA